MDRCMENSAGHELGEGLVGGLDFGVCRVLLPAAQPESLKREVFENQEAVGNFQRLASHRAVGHMRRTGCEGVGEVQGAGSADGVESEFGKRAVAELAGFAA